MPFDSSGNYSLPPSYFVEAGDLVLPIQHNPPLEDIAAALNNVVLRSGVGAWLGNQNASGFRLTNLGAAVNPGDAVNLTQLRQATPIGAVMDFAGINAPASWMFCYGQELNRVEFSALFAEIGTTYGSGNGTTTFNLPDCRDRVSVGKGNMGGTAANRITNAVAGFNTTVLGAAGGVQEHVLTAAQMPAHAHGAVTTANGAHTHTAQAAGNHAHGGAVVAAGAHNHLGATGAAGGHFHTGLTIPVDNNVGPGPGVVQSAGGDGVPTLNGTVGAVGDHQHVIAFDGNHQHGIVADGSHTHVINGTGDHIHAIAAEGGGLAHPNVQPSITFNKIIKVS